MLFRSYFEVMSGKVKLYLKLKSDFNVNTEIEALGLTLGEAAPRIWHSNNF